MTDFENVEQVYTSHWRTFLSSTSCCRVHRFQLWELRFYGTHFSMLVSQRYAV